MSTSPPTPSATIDESDAPQPKRFRWLMRLSIAAAVTLVALVGIRIWWGSAAQARLQVEIDRIKAAGDPLFVEDFQSPSVADEDNAAWYMNEALLKLADIMPAEARSRFYDDEPEDMPQTDEDEYFRRAAEASALIRQARHAPHVDWGVEYQSPLLLLNLPHLAPMRRLSRGLEDNARRHAARGDWAQALSRVEELHIIADKVAQPSPMLIDYLMSISIRAMSTGVVQEHIGNLAFDRAEGESGNAPREQVLQLIQLLLDASHATDDAVRAMIGERAGFFDTGESIANGSIDLNALDTGTTGSSVSTRLTAALVGPMLRLDVVRGLHRMDTVIEAVQAPRLPAAVNQLRPAPPPVPKLQGVVQILSSMTLPAESVLLQADHRTRANLRMAATALAIRLFEMDHGRRPATLDELVPDYLALVPLDPMAADERPLGYLPEGVDPAVPWALLYGEPLDSLSAEMRLGRKLPVLYSVGVDGRDDKGTFQLANDGTAQQSREAGFDMVFLLNGPVTDMPEPPANEWDDPLDDLWDYESDGEADIDDGEPAEDGGDADEDDPAQGTP